MSCGTGECGCGCGELHQIRVKPGVVLKVGTTEPEGEGPQVVLAGAPKRLDGSEASGRRP